MKISLMPLVFGVLIFGWAANASAEDKMGLRLLVTKKTLDRADGKPGYSKEIDRTMALKAFFKNISNKDLPEGLIHCSILIRRWGTETGTLELNTKEIKLEALKTAQEVDQLVGEYHIGGHMHGNSDMHVDQIVAWKIVVDHAGKKTEFLSGSNYETLSKRATPASS